MKRNLIVVAVLALLAAVSPRAQAAGAAVGSRGGKKSVVRMNDANGNPVLFNADKPWKVFEASASGLSQLVDESGVAPKQGMIHQVCIGTAATTGYAVVYDTNTASGAVALTTAGVKLHPALAYSTSLTQCFTFDAMFTSGAVVELGAAAVGNGAVPGGGAYVYWRELGGYR